MLTLDVAIFRSINGLAGRDAWRDALGVFSATYLIWILVGLIAAYSLAVWWEARGLERRFDGPIMAFRAFVATALGWIGNAVIGWLWLRPRPFAELSDVVKLIGKPMTQKSFPSDHATAAFALAFSVAFLRPGFGLIMLILALQVAFGRVFVGVHYPSDVLAGCLVGLTWAIIVRWAGVRWGDRRLLAKIFGRRPKVAATQPAKQ